MAVTSELRRARQEIVALGGVAADADRADDHVLAGDLLRDLGGVRDIAPWRPRAPEPLTVSVAGLRATTVTWWPRSSASCTMRWPMLPVPP